MNKAIAEAESFKVMDDHRISIQEFCQRYETDPVKGLTESEAEKRLQLYGENKLSQR